MTNEPKIEHRDEQPYVAIRTRVKMSDIPAVLPPLVPQITHCFKLFSNSAGCN